MYFFAFPLLLLASTICASPVRIESRSYDPVPLLPMSRIVPRNMPVSMVLPKDRRQHQPAYGLWLGRETEKIPGSDEVFPVPRRVSEHLGVVDEVVVTRVKFDTTQMFAKIQGEILNLKAEGELVDWAWEELPSGRLSSRSPPKSPSKSSSSKSPPQYASYIVTKQKDKGAGGPGQVPGPVNKGAT